MQEDHSPSISAPLQTADDQAPRVLVQVRGLGMRHDSGWVQRELDFEVHAGRTLAVIGPSGCGKSTLLRHMIGLLRPAEGRVSYAMPGEAGPPSIDIHHCDAEQARALRRHFGVSFQGGALWSTMTLLENLMLPLAMLSDDPPARQRERAMARLAEVDLADHARKAVGDLSGGMRKRAAIARALVLDPPLLYLDEPSAGLDPVSAARLDALMCRLRDAGTALVVITHDLASIDAVADRALFLDAERHTAIALDTPQALREHGPRQVQDFLERRADAPDTQERRHG